MRITPHEQAQDALQFTALAVGILLVLRFGLAAALHLVPLPAPDALTASAVGYHADHILRRPGTVVLGAWPWVARLALATMVSSICAAVMAVVLGGIANLLGKPGSVWALMAARVTLLITGLWCMAAVFILPPRSIRFSKDGAVLTERTSLLGQLSFPGKAHVRSIAWNDMVSVVPVESASGTAFQIHLRDGQQVQLDLPERDDAGSSAPPDRDLLTLINVARSTAQAH
jgi:hypothetical protein